MKTITSIGNGSNFITSALMGMGGTQQDKNGRFFLDGSCGICFRRSLCGLD